MHLKHKIRSHNLVEEALGKPDAVFNGHNGNSSLFVLVLLVEDVDGLTSPLDVGFLFTFVPTADEILWVELHLVVSERDFFVHVYLSDLSIKTRTRNKNNDATGPTL